MCNCLKGELTTRSWELKGQTRAPNWELVNELGTNKHPSE